MGKETVMAPDQQTTRVVALTAGRYDPSSRLRVRQHIAPLKTDGLAVTECFPLIDKYAAFPFPIENRSLDSLAPPLTFLWRSVKFCTRIPGVLRTRTGHITWLLRDLFPGRLTLEPLLKKPLVFDIDDALWLNEVRGANHVMSIAQRADVVIAGNSYIASHIEPYARSLAVVPTAIDTERFRPEPSAPCERTGRFTIGWIGTASNLPYLYSVELPIARFLTDHPDSDLLVISNEAPRFKVLSQGHRVHYTRWSEEDEVAELKRVDVGIMPLPDTEWTRGKCSLKMLQYMACGIPVVVSPVGMNVEVLAKGPSGLTAASDAEWYDAFSFFRKNTSSAKTHGSAGRAVVEAYYSREIVSPMLAGIFSGLR
jgi:glycosyltransferase involved in cell wall biosynthesis